MNKKAFTIIELMITLIILTLVLTALWHIFSSARKNAKEITENHTINFELEKALLKITDDVREANHIASECPKIIEQSEIDSLSTDSEDNVLCFLKVDFDFSIDITKKNYTQNEIKYYVEKKDSKYTLYRKSKKFEFDDDGMSQLVEEGDPKPILSGFEECVFYRLHDPNVPRTGNIYIKIKMKRQDKSDYTSETVISVKERGVLPQ